MILEIGANLAAVIGGVTVTACMMYAGYKFIEALAKIDSEYKDRDRMINEEYTKPTPPKIGTLRYASETPAELPVAALDRVLTFSRQHTIGFNGFATQNDITASAEAFFERMHNCKSDQETSICLMQFKLELEAMLKSSDIPKEYKDKFHRALNPFNLKNLGRGVFTVLGIILLMSGASTSGISLLVNLFIAATPYVIFELLCPEHRIFNSHSIASNINIFNSLVAELNNIVTEAEAAMKPQLRP